MHALSGCDTVSYYYATGNDIVIKVLQDGYLPPILDETDITLSFMVQEYGMCFYVLRVLLDLVVQSFFLANNVQLCFKNVYIQFEHLSFIPLCWSKQSL